MVSVDGAPSLLAQGTVTINDLRPGRHYITISDMARHCAASANRPIFSGELCLKPHTQTTGVFNRWGVNWQETAMYNRHGCHEDDDDRPRAWNQWDQQQPRNWYFDNIDMQQLTGTLQHTSFESTKISIVKQAVANRTLYTDQVVQLLSYFSFESSKLDLAKYLYGNVADKQNYYQLSNAFAFDSSINDLNNFLASR